jgi:hypothetical protein
VGVVLEAEHSCMTLRGVRAHGAKTVTSALLGTLRADPVICIGQKPSTSMTARVRAPSFRHGRLCHTEQAFLSPVIVPLTVGPTGRGTGINDLRLGPASDQVMVAGQPVP